MGKIAAANVLSDMYAVGVDDVTNVLMVLSTMKKMSKLANDVCMSLVMKGFDDLVNEAGSKVTGGQTVRNEEMILGGVAMSVCTEKDFVDPFGAEDGDILVLTKPLGTQIAVNAHQWLDNTKRGIKKYDKYYEMIKEVVNEEQIFELYEAAKRSMICLNRWSAKLMKQYGAHCATDITGFGLINHCQNLCENQKGKVDFVLEKVPVLKNAIKIEKALKDMFSLFAGKSAETSGGLLVAIPPQNVDNFVKEVSEKQGVGPWIVGKVVNGNGKARFGEGVEFFDVDF